MIAAVIEHADSGDDQDGDPDLFEDVQSQRRAAVKQNVARAEQKNDLVQRRARLDIDQPEPVRADRNAGNQEYRDVGNSDLLRQQAGQRPDGQNEAAGKKRVPGDLDGGGRFQWVFSPGDAIIGAAHWRRPSFAGATLPYAP